MWVIKYIYKIPIKFIKFNPKEGLRISNNESLWIENIKKELPDLRIKVFFLLGKKIGSSYGEFTKHYYHEEIESKKDYEEFKKWKLKHEIYE